MGLDTPTPTGSSSVASSNGSGGGCGGSGQHTASGFDPFGTGNPVEIEPKSELGTDGTLAGGIGTLADDNNFAEDLSGLDDLGPIGPPAGTNLIDPKVEVQEFLNF